MTVRNTLFFLIMLAAKFLFGQDAHYTQVFNTPVYHNPAATGHGVENIRLTAVYRNQWNGLMTPFTTQAVFFDKQVSKVGLGLGVHRNSAGSSGITKINLGGSLSYREIIGQHQIAAGIYIGLMQKSFDPTKMMFDEQYTEDGGFDPALPNGETFSYTKLTRPDAGAGIYWTRGTKENKIKFKPFAGVALAHINQAKEIFITEENKAFLKKTVQAGAGFMVMQDVEITPSIMYATQQFSHELNTGVKGSIMFEDRIKIEAGIYHRKQDAWIAYTGYQWNSLMIGLSYDIGTSSIRQGNSFELTLTYIPKAKEKRDTKYTKPKDQAEKLPPAKTKLPDGDQDGIADVADKCPDVSGITALKGCPDKTKEPTKKQEPKAINSTNEKVVLKQTAVVEQEKFLNIKVDTDSDGVEDLFDACPYIKGGLKTNGCPDSDDDGIIDMDDKCPMEIGNQANKGCPDVETVSTASKTNNIEFETGMAVVKGFDVIDILEPASDKLVDDANTMIIITGHTDNEGDVLTNMMLSQNRADAVKEYFIKHGISSGRIKTIAYGETMPMMKNGTEEGKQRNRRAEINIIQRAD